MCMKILNLNDFRRIVLNHKNNLYPRSNARAYVLVEIDVEGNSLAFESIPQSFIWNSIPWVWLISFKGENPELNEHSPTGYEDNKIAWAIQVRIVPQLVLPETQFESFWEEHMEDRL